MRYKGQGSEVTVAWPGDAAAAAAAFSDAHRGLFGFKLDLPVQIVTVRVEAEGRLPDPVTSRVAASGPPRQVGTVLLDGPNGRESAPVFDRAHLAVGVGLPGPAIVTQLDATTLVRAGWEAEVLPTGALMLRKM